VSPDYNTVSFAALILPPPAEQWEFTFRYGFSHHSCLNISVSHRGTHPPWPCA